MAGETESTAQDAVEENDDDFDAGFAPAASLTATPPADAAAPEPTPTPVPTPAPTEPPKYAQITEDELTDLRARAALVDEIKSTSKKQFDTAFGKIGALEQILTKLQTATPAGETVAIDEADFEELKAEYPEIARMQISGLNKMLAKHKGTSSVDPAAIEKMVSDKVGGATAEVRKEIIDASLEAVFPGWKKDVGKPEFKSVIDSLPADTKALMNSLAVGDAATFLKEMYAAKNKPAATPAPSPTPAPSTTRQRQIAAAVPPRGDGGHPPGPSEDDEFNAGFKSG